MEDNELEDNEKSVDDNQPSEDRAGGATNYVKGYVKQIMCVCVDD